jgi:ATP-dependent helicase/nuclease subunit A
MQKVAINLRDTLHQLQHLRNAAGWDDVVARKNIDYGRLTFPRKGIDTDLAERIKACRNGCKKGLEKHLRNFSDDSDTVLKDLADSAEGARGLVALVRQFGAEYDRAKRSRRCLDFGDLEHKMLDLVLGVRRSGPTMAAREIGQMFREIMVDEYQDSNGVQDAIISALTAQRQNCFMVGDVKQSIYQFRLADPGIFLEKYHRFVSAGDAKPGEGRKVLLSANFRSGGEVIDAVNDVFMECMSPDVGGLFYGDAEKLREGIPHEKLSDPAVEFYGLEIREDTYAEESAFVAARIRQMLESGTLIRDGAALRPVTAEDIVILLRSPGSVGQKFQQALERIGIRCTSGGGTDLLKTSEIATLRSFLQTIANPRQDIPLISALASPVFGFTADDLAAIRSKCRKGSVYDALLADGSPKTKAFLSVLSELRKAARMNTVSKLIEQIFTLTRMDSIYAAMDGGDAAASNLQTFFGIASDYESTSRRDLTQFLEYLDSMEEKGLKTDGEESGGAVTIMSIHKSKGLEFPVVFLCGLSREFNRENLRAQVLCDKELGLGLSVADTLNRVRYPAVSKRAIVAKSAAESLSEEMRVLYVAMTRARDRLVMTYASRNLQSDLQDISLRYDLCGAQLLTRDVVCPGEWVLLSTLLRTEAGEMHNLGGKPSRTRVSDHPWLIRVAEAPLQEQSETEKDRGAAEIPEELIRKLGESLSFRYAHQEATHAPSKQTATQRKGRSKDSEAAEDSQEPRQITRSWRKPSFAGDRRQGKTYGSAVHAAMQYLRYGSCGSAGEIREELERLVSGQFLTREQADLVNCDALAAFFGSEFGIKLRSGANYIREFKFSILDDGSNYGEGLDGEQVLVQGVVDCALLEEDGITVLDFKTDYVTEQTLPGLTEHYRSQVQTYAHALSRIYNKKIKASYLYFFRLNRFVPV